MKLLLIIFISFSAFGASDKKYLDTIEEVFNPKLRDSFVVCYRSKPLSCTITKFGPDTSKFLVEFKWVSDTLLKMEEVEKTPHIHLVKKWF